MGLWQSLLGGAMPFSDRFRRWHKSSLPMPGLCSFPQGTSPVVAYSRGCLAPSRARDIPAPTPTTPTACGGSGCGSRTAGSSCSSRTCSECGPRRLWARGQLHRHGGASAASAQALRLRGPAAGAAPGADRSPSPCRLEGSSCSYDAIEVYDGGSPQGWRLGLVCRDDRRVFNSSGNQLTVVFRSDGSVTNRGFHAYYSSFLAFHTTVGKTRAALYYSPGQKLKLNHKEILEALNTSWASRPFAPTGRHSGSRAFFRIGWPRRCCQTLFLWRMGRNGTLSTSPSAATELSSIVLASAVGRGVAQPWHTHCCRSQRLLLVFPK